MLNDIIRTLIDSILVASFQPRSRNVSGPVAHTIQGYTSENGLCGREVCTHQKAGEAMGSTGS